jgi:hypothetical protein
MTSIPYDVYNVYVLGYVLEYPYDSTYVRTSKRQTPKPQMRTKAPPIENHLRHEGGAARSCVTINNIKFTVSLRQIVIS